MFIYAFKTWASSNCLWKIYVARLMLKKKIYENFLIANGTSSSVHTHNKDRWLKVWINNLKLVFFILVDIIYGLEKLFAMKQTLHHTNCDGRWKGKKGTEKVFACINFSELLIILKQVKSHFPHFSPIFILPSKYLRRFQQNSSYVFTRKRIFVRSAVIDLEKEFTFLVKHWLHFLHKHVEITYLRSSDPFVQR